MLHLTVAEKEEARNRFDLAFNRNHRKQHPEQLHVLVYEKSDRKIVKVILPVGIVDSCTDLEHWIEEECDEFGFEKRYDLKKYRLNRKKFRNLIKILL